MLKFEGMEVLMWKIEDCLSKVSPDAKRIGISEGGQRNILDLLYVLKGAGVIGLIDDDILSSKSGLDDLVYIFDIDKDKFKEFKETYRKENDVKISPAKYDSEKMVIAYRGRDLSIKPGSRLAMLWVYVFPKSWYPSELGCFVRRDDGNASTRQREGLEANL